MTTTLNKGNNMNTIVLASQLMSGHTISHGDHTLLVLSAAPHGLTKKTIKVTVLTKDMAVMTLFVRKDQKFLVSE